MNSLPPFIILFPHCTHCRLRPILKVVSRSVAARSQEFCKHSPDLFQLEAWPSMQNAGLHFAHTIHQVGLQSQHLVWVLFMPACESKTDSNIQLHHRGCTNGNVFQRGNMLKVIGTGRRTVRRYNCATRSVVLKNDSVASIRAIISLDQQWKSHQSPDSHRDVPLAVSHQPSAISHQPSAVSRQPYAVSRHSPRGPRGRGMDFHMEVTRSEYTLISLDDIG